MYLVSRNRRGVETESRLAVHTALTAVGAAFAALFADKTAAQASKPNQTAASVVFFPLTVVLDAVSLQRTQATPVFLLLHYNLLWRALLVLHLCGISSVSCSTERMRYMRLTYGLLLVAVALLWWVSLLWWVALGWVSALRLAVAVAALSADLFVTLLRAVALTKRNMEERMWAQATHL